MNLEKLKYFLEIPEELLRMNKEELKHIFGSDFAMMKGYSQNNPHHCYDLLEHTIKTVESLDCSGLSKSEIIELKIAALYHDVGKPTVAFEKNGKTVFYNHAKVSKNIVEKEFKTSSVGEQTIDKICFFVEYHDMFISFKLRDEINKPNNPHIKEITNSNVKKEIVKAIRERKSTGLFVPSYHDFNVLMRLCCADASAQSEKVMENGKEIDSRQRKLSRLSEIERLINYV